MITRIEGVIKLKGGNFVVLDANGAGYKVFISVEVLRKMPKAGEQIVLWTHLYVRENALELYGFLNYAELEFFEQLIQISGIGPKSGLAILTVAPLDVLKKAIASGETSYLTKVSGIGRRLAEKIILELKDKMGAIGVQRKEDMFKEGGDALEALRVLGYSFKESREALYKVPEDTRGIENIIKEALKNINKR